MLDESIDVKMTLAGDHKDRPSTPKLRKGVHRLELPVGEPRPEVIRLFALECLVPLLAEEFLRTTGPARPKNSVTSGKRTAGVLGKETGR